MLWRSGERNPFLGTDGGKLEAVTMEESARTGW